jgi:hypothetical protein
VIESRLHATRRCTSCSSTHLNRRAACPHKARATTRNTHEDAPICLNSWQNPAESGGTGNIARGCIDGTEPVPLCANSERSPKQRAMIAATVLAQTSSRRVHSRRPRAVEAFPSSIGVGLVELRSKRERQILRSVIPYSSSHFIASTHSALGSCELLLWEARLSVERDNLG